MGVSLLDSISDQLQKSRAQPQKEFTWRARGFDYQEDGVRALGQNDEVTAGELEYDESEVGSEEKVPSGVIPSTKFSFKNMFTGQKKKKDGDKKRDENKKKDKSEGKNSSG